METRGRTVTAGASGGIRSSAQRGGMRNDASSGAVRALSACATNFDAQSSSGSSSSVQEWSTVAASDIASVATEGGRGAAASKRLRGAGTINQSP